MLTPNDFRSCAFETFQPANLTARCGAKRVFGMEYDMNKSLSPMASSIHHDVDLVLKAVTTVIPSRRWC